MKCNPLMEKALSSLSKEDRSTLTQARRDAKISGYEEKGGPGIDINSKILTAIQKLTYASPGKMKAKFSYDNLRRQLLKEGVSKKEIALSLLPYKGKKELWELQMKANNNRLKTSEIPESSSMPEYREASKEFEDIRDYTEMGVYSKGTRDDSYTKHFREEEDFLGWFRENTDTIEGKDVRVLQEFQSDWAQGVNKDSFPIDYSDFKKLAIVNGIDGAMRRGMDTLIIPIDRSGSLKGSETISEMYSELQKGILPKIKAQLAKAGLKLDVEVVKKPGESNDLVEDYFKLTIGKQKNHKKIRWDMLGVIGALGLTGEYDKLKETK